MSSTKSSSSTLGSPAKGGKPSRSKTPKPKKISTKGLRKTSHLEMLVGTQRLCCESRLCAARTTPIRGGDNKCLRSAKVTSACRCIPCSKVGGVVMCRDCYHDRKKHLSALQYAVSPRKDGTPRDRPELKFRKKAQ
ncbi:unnamed protein product [Laminaria digitata]